MNGERCANWRVVRKLGRGAGTEELCEDRRVVSEQESRTGK